MRLTSLRSFSSSRLGKSRIAIFALARSVGSAEQNKFGSALGFRYFCTMWKVYALLPAL